MSGGNAGIAMIPLLANPPPDPIGVQSRLAQLVAAQQAGIQAQQHTIGGALDLAKQRAFFGFLPGGNQALAGIPGAPPPLPGGGGGSALMPGGGAGGGGAGGSPSGGLSGPGSMFGGGPVPAGQSALALYSKDPDTAFKTTQALRIQRLNELQNTYPFPEAVQRAVAEGYTDPQMGQALLASYQKDPAGTIQRARQSLATAGETLAYQASLARQGVQEGETGSTEVAPAVLQAKGGAAYTEKQQGLAAEQGLPPQPVPNMGGGGGSGAGLSSPATAPAAHTLVDSRQPMTGADYVAAVHGAEGTGAARTSTADGTGQFIKGTWLDQVRKNRPDIAAGKTDAQLLALRNTDPALADQMIQTYAQENAPILAKAGFDVNAATLGIAHRLGPSDAVKVLQAPADTPLPSLLSQDVLDANPELRRQTAGTFVRGMAAKYGARQVNFGGGGQAAAAPAPVQVAGPGAPTGGTPPPSAAAAPPGAPSGPAAAPPSAAPVAVPGVPAGVPSVAGVAAQKAAADAAVKLATAGPIATAEETARQEAILKYKPSIEGLSEGARQDAILARANQIETARKLAELAVDPAIAGATAAAKAPIELNAKLAESDIKPAQEASELAEQARDNLVTAQKIGDLAGQVATGKGTDFLNGVGQWLERLGASHASVADLTGVDPSKAQQLEKYMTRGVVDAERNVTARGGIGLTRYLADALPSMASRPDAIQHITNLMRTVSQVGFDVENGAVEHNAAQQAAVKANPAGPYTTIPQYYAQQSKRFTSNVVVAAANLLSGDDLASVMKGLTQQQRVEVIGLAHRTNPAAPLHGYGAAPAAPGQ